LLGPPRIVAGLSTSPMGPPNRRYALSIIVRPAVLSIGSLWRLARCVVDGLAVWLIGLACGRSARCVVVWLLRGWLAWRVIDQLAVSSIGHRVVDQPAASSIGWPSGRLTRRVVDQVAVWLIGSLC